MARQAQQVRRLAGTLTGQAGVTVEAEYQPGERYWQLRWVDGPTVGSMRALAESAGRTSTQVEIAELDWRRGSTELAVVAATLAYLRANPQERQRSRRSGEDLHDDTEYPERLDPALLAQARNALTRTSQRGVDDSAAAIDYLRRVGVIAVAADHWLASLRGRRTRAPGGVQGSPDAIQAPIVETGMLDTELRDTMRQFVGELVQAIAGPTDDSEGPRGLRQVWAAEQARHLLLSEIDQRQRHSAAVECAEGASLRELSRQLGLDPSTLRKRWPDLHQRNVPPLRWLREHADEWRAALTALTTSLGRAQRPVLNRDQRTRVLMLERRSATSDWHDLIGTPEAVQSLLPALRSAVQSARDP